MLRKLRGVVLDVMICLAMLALPMFAFAQDPTAVSELLRALGPWGVMVELIRILGLPGMIFLIWYFDRRQIQGVLDKYGEDMEEMREMYKSNVRLVEETQSIGKSSTELARALKDIIILNTQKIQEMSSDIETNQFCPQVRLHKKAPGPVGGG